MPRTIRQSRLHRHSCAAAFVAALLLSCLVPGGVSAAYASCQLVSVKTVAGDPAPNLSARISYVEAPNGATVAYEGVVERLSDLLIYDSASGAACFQAGNVITLTYAAALLTPPGIDVFDSARPSGLAVTTERSGNFIVRITVTRAGTAGNLVSTSAGAALRVKNLRADVSTISPGLNVTVQAAASAIGTLGGSIRNVGYVSNLAAAGAGIHTLGAGAQNAGATLSTAAVFSLTENFADALRVAGSSGVAGDAPSGATSLVFDLANTVPPGVTVTFPPAIVTVGLSFAMRYGGSCSGPVQCFAIYDTTANAAGNGTLTVTTAASARTGADGSTPAIGVEIASNSGIGTVTLRALFGPGVAGGANDDVNPGAIPRYVAASSPGAAPTRSIFSGPWFTVVPGAPLLALSPPRIAFGGMLVGTGRQETVVLTNTSTQLLQIGSITLSGADFQLDNGCPTLLSALSSCTFSVRFAPTSALERHGTVTVVSDAAGSPHLVPLTGEGQVVHAVPAISSLSPSSVQAGAGWTRLVVNGSNFAPGAIVQWNGVGLGTSVLSDTQLAAGIPPDDLAAVGNAAITVVNPPPGGGTSNAVTFTVFAGPLPAKPYLYYVPHVVSGGGFVTRFTVVDLGPAENAVSVHYIGQSGALLGETAFRLASGGTLRIQAPGLETSGPVTSQWAVLGAEAPLAVHVVLEQPAAGGDPRSTNSVGFADCVPADAFAIPAEFEPAPAGSAIGRTMGLAIANPSPAGVTAELKLVDPSGNVLASHGFSLPPFGQIAVDLQQVEEFRAVLPASNFVGSVTGSATAPVCALALLDNYGPFLVAPVVKKAK